MDHAVIAFNMAQRLAPKPVKQRIPIRRIQDVVEGIALAALAEAFRGHQQRKVMIPKDGDRRRSQVTYETQSLQRTRTAIDEVADQPELVDRRIERATLKQTRK